MNSQDASIASDIHAVNASNFSQNLVTRISLKRNNYANAIIQRVPLYVRPNLLNIYIYTSFELKTKNCCFCSKKRAGLL